MVAGFDTAGDTVPRYTEQVNYLKEKLRNSAATWIYTLIGNGQLITGEVAAIDPRDAVSRTLTTSNADGKMHGQHLGVDINLLSAVPANFDKFYEVKSGTTYL